ESDQLEFPPPVDDRINEAQVWQALGTVFDPEIPVDLVNLGLIYSVNVDQEAKRVDIQMTLTAPACGMGPVLVGDVEYRVRKVPNVNTVKVELVFDPPWQRHMMSEEAQLQTGMFYRSEEHTSEFQSREKLVCRLLLEKKKTPVLVVSSLEYCYYS